MSRVAPNYPNRIKACIHAAGYKIREITRELDIPERTMRSYMAGQTPMPRDYLEAIAHIIGCSVRDLSVGELEKGIDRERDGTTQKEDWGEAPSPEQFFGRDEELTRLKTWIVEDHCRLVSILGMGGIGKTSLAMMLASQIQGDFEYVFWRSLQNAPFLSSILQDCLKFLSDQQRTDLPDTPDGQITLLLEYLRARRCLLILDNVETILQAGTDTGSYREGYQGYKKVFQRIGETRHGSCLLLTSREKPPEVALLEGNLSPVRSQHLKGVGHKEGRELLSDKGLLGSDHAWRMLIQLYAGNPLALKLISEPIRELFNANIDAFLKEEQTVVGNIHELLDQQFQRLPAHERDLMYWLAIEREAVTLETLWEDTVSFISKKALLNALASLKRRSMIETSDTAQFTLQPVIMEYVTDEFTRHISDEIHAEAARLLASHALIKAQAKEYVRETQVRLILIPIIERLLSRLTREELEQKCKTLLASLHEGLLQKPTYAAGNLLNLLIQMRCDLRGYDFSRLSIRQAFLQGAILPEVNFAYADLSASVFTDTFGSILSLAYSPDGNYFATCTSNNEIRLWQSNGTLMQTFHGHSAWVRSVMFHPDTSTLVSCSNDQTIRLWDVNNGQCIRILQGHINRVWSATFSPDGKLIASGGDDLSIRIWETSSGRCLKTLQGHTNRVDSVVFSPDGSILVSGSEDQTIRLWEIQSGRCLKTLEGHTGWIRSVIVSPDGSILASGGSDQAIRLWNIESGQCLKMLQGHTGWIYSVAFSPDGNLLASGSGDQTIRLWNIESGQCLKILQGHTGWVRSVAFSPNGSILASGSEDQTVRLWETQNGRSLKVLEGYNKLINAIAMSFDGHMLVSGGDDLCLWEMSSGRCLKVLQGHSSWVYGVAFHPDGTMIASSSSDHTVRLWKISSGQCFKILQGHSKCVWSIAFHPDGKTIASGSNDLTVRLWAVDSDPCLSILRGHTGWVYTVAFSSDGSVIASGSDDQTIRLWETKTGQCLQVLRGHTNRVWSVAFSPDGSTLVSGSEDETIRVWAIHSGQCLKTLQGHTGQIRSVAFSRDGNIVASGGKDQTVRVWDVNSGCCLMILQGHQSGVKSVVFGQSENAVLSGGDDGTVKLWDAQTGEVLKTFITTRPYEGMNITAIAGITPAQKAALMLLGAFEDQRNTGISQVGHGGK